MNNKIAIFKGKGIRRTIHNDKRWFSIVDVCGVLVES
jgi:DNA-damage-inducible protein D